jgi:3-dehydroquinate synthase
MSLDTAAGRCAISINESAANLKKFLDGRKGIVAITDSNVRRLYRHLLADYDIIEIRPGEEAKTLQTAETIYRKFLRLDLDRSSFVLAIGGGVVTDIAGFCASTFMRGIPFGFVPTTLLAQVDAAIGGKNGVDLDRYKNIVGVFSQPRFILMDFKFLKTLPQREVRSGAAEIIKHALIAGPALFRDLENDEKGLLSLKRGTLEKIVFQSVKIKANIVKADEFERGERRKLNFGHTLGHAVERIYGLRHGEAVSIGMVMAAAMSVAKGLLSWKEFRRITALLGTIGLPVRIPSDAEAVLETVRRDKKRDQEDIHFVFLRKIGKAEIQKIKFRDLEEHVRDLCQHR